jgi:1,4-dihydroxy-2-naphthoyl-CoA hydrolase
VRIFFQPIDLAQLNQEYIIHLAADMGIVFCAFGEDFLQGSMPVDAGVYQAFGILHGGASVVLAETIGSVAANCCVNFQTHYCVGLDINANHIRSVREGMVYATARPLHIGRSTQVWNIPITDESDRLICISRLTMAVMAR